MKEEMNIEEEIAILEFNLNIKYQEINCRDFFKVEYFFRSSYFNFFN